MLWRRDTSGIYPTTVSKVLSGGQAAVLGHTHNAQLLRLLYEAGLFAGFCHVVTGPPAQCPVTALAAVVGPIIRPADTCILLDAAAGRCELDAHPLWSYMGFFSGWDKQAAAELFCACGDIRWFQNLRSWLAYWRVRPRYNNAKPGGRGNGRRRGAEFRTTLLRLRPTPHCDQYRRTRRLAVWLYYAWKQAVNPHIDSLLCPAACFGEVLGAEYTKYVQSNRGGTTTSETA